jgi:hypothetical protein
VLASGVIWKGSFDSEAIASLGAPVELAPDTSQFSCQYFPESETNEAKYVYSWYNSLVNRNVDNLLSGRIELYRNGDILVATNGVERIIPRVLPFEHAGYGQDEEWVLANFTNATRYFLHPSRTNWLDHSQCGANVWCVIPTTDRAGCEGECPQPWGEGGAYSWSIPILWRFKTNPESEKYLCTIEQSFSIDSNGTYKVSKFGYIGTCHTNRLHSTKEEF